MDKLTELLAGIDWTPCPACEGKGRRGQPALGYHDCRICLGWRYPGVRALVERLCARESLDAAFPPLNVEQVLIDDLRAKLAAAEDTISKLSQRVGAAHRLQQLTQYNEVRWMDKHTAAKEEVK